MPKTVWKKLESWKPVQMSEDQWWLTNGRHAMETAKRHLVTRKTYAAALAAANKQNRLEGLPEVQ